MAAVIFTAFTLEALIGDPRSKLHPVVLIGKLIVFWERKLLRQATYSWQKKLSGAVLVVIVLFTSILFIMAGFGGSKNSATFGQYVSGRIFIILYFQSTQPGRSQSRDKKTAGGQRSCRGPEKKPAG